jgi:hypothetical protein
MASASRTHAAQKYVSISNTRVGNGWPEEMTCPIEAEALKFPLITSTLEDIDV